MPDFLVRCNRLLCESVFTTYDARSTDLVPMALGFSLTLLRSSNANFRSSLRSAPGIRRAWSSVATSANRRRERLADPGGARPGARMAKL